MVGFDPESEKKLSHLDHSTAGAISGFTTRFLLQPLDVLKIRFQLQIEPINRRSASSKYQGLYHATKSIVREESFMGLWKGHVPAQILSVMYGVIQFSSFEMYTKQLLLRFPGLHHTEPLAHTLCGALAGCSATFFTHPFDVLRTRLIAQGEPKVYVGMGQAVVRMMQDEGPRSFFRGLLPNMIQVAPYVGAQFGFYQLLLNCIWKPNLQLDDIAWVLKSIVFGGVAGAAAKGICYPLDLIKKRLQVQGFERARKPFGSIRIYTSPIHCLRTVFAEEGIRGFYKGLFPSLIKSSLATSCNFTVYEMICKYLRSNI